MILTFDIDTLLISIFDNIVSNQEIRHFVPLWPYIFKVFHFWSSWLLTYLRGISFGTVWAIFLCNWLRLKISLSISRHFVLMLFFSNHFLLILPSMDRFFFFFFCDLGAKMIRNNVAFFQTELYGQPYTSVLEHPIKSLGKHSLLKSEFSPVWLPWQPNKISDHDLNCIIWCTDTLSFKNCRYHQSKTCFRSIN